MNELFSPAGLASQVLYSEVRMPMVRLELQPLGYKPIALATQLYSSKAIAGKELSLSS